MSVLRLTKTHERVEAGDLGEIVRGHREDGHRVYLRPRGPHGARFGQFVVETAFLNPDPATVQGSHASPARSYGPRETVIMWSAATGYTVSPVRYPFGKGTRPVTWRVFVA